jgi:hypothetical protein
MYAAGQTKTTRWLGSIPAPRCPWRLPRNLRIGDEYVIATVARVGSITHCCRANAPHTWQGQRPSRTWRRYTSLRTARALCALCLNRACWVRSSAVTASGAGSRAIVLMAGSNSAVFGVFIQTRRSSDWKSQRIKPMCAASGPALQPGFYEPRLEPEPAAERPEGRTPSGPPPMINPCKFGLSPGRTAFTQRRLGLSLTTTSTRLIS